jgi:formiminoglutamase
MKQIRRTTLPLWQSTRKKTDPYVTNLAEWIEPWQGDDQYDLCLLGVPLSKSSISFSGAHAHPDQFRQLWPSFSTYFWDEDIDLQDLKIADLGHVEMHITDIAACHQHIQEASQDARKHLPSSILVSIGGDHSITAPLLKGIQQQEQKRIGLIQFDAHLDVRDLHYGGPSNGTPIRNVIESQVIRGEDIYTIGIRNFANSKHYRTYAETQGMHIFSATEVHRLGMESILSEAIEQLTATCDALYITVDLDALDQSIVPGVPAIGPNGLSTEMLFPAMFTLGQCPKVIGIDFVCVDPSKDFRDLTSRVSLHAFLHFAAGVYQRRQKDR